MRRCLPVLAILLLVGPLVTTAWSHHTPNEFEPALYGPTKDPIKSRGQVEAGIRYIERAIAQLTNAEPTPEAVFMAQHLMVEGYYFIRAASASLNLRSTPRGNFVDPLLYNGYQRCERAMGLIRNSRLELNYVLTGDPKHLEPAIEKLYAALQEANTVLLLI